MPKQFSSHNRIGSDYPDRERHDERRGHHDRQSCARRPRAKHRRRRRRGTAARSAGATRRRAQSEGHRRAAVEHKAGLGHEADHSAISRGSVTPTGLVSPAVITQSIGGAGGFIGFVNIGVPAAPFASASLGAASGGGTAPSATVNNNAVVNTTQIGSTEGLASELFDRGGSIAQ
jgi:hypothetical protein